MPKRSQSTSGSTELKSIWREIERKDFRFYCAGCHRERRLFAPPKVGTFRHFFQVFIATSFFTLLTWPLWEWKGVVAFIPIWIAFEAIFRMKMRSALVCNDCGFDPILYLVDSKKAAAAVEQHWRKRFEEKGWAYPEKKVRNRSHPTPQVSAVQQIEDHEPSNETNQ
jgi:hypothetical protein